MRANVLDGPEPPQAVKLRRREAKPSRACGVVAACLLWRSSQPCKRIRDEVPTGCCHGVATGRPRRATRRIPDAPKPRPCRASRCARMDSNHHGEISPQGPQPCTHLPDLSAGVQNVQIVRFPGHIGRIWMGDCCHDVATLTPAPQGQRPAVGVDWCRSLLLGPTVTRLLFVRSDAAGPLFGGDRFATEAARFAGRESARVRWRMS
jgi:hypothetical protein